MKVKVLGTGCANCHTLEDRANQALQQLGMDETVEMVDEPWTIAEYGVMSTPALVIDEEVVLSGRVPKVSELVSILTGSMT